MMKRSISVQHTRLLLRALAITLILPLAGACEKFLDENPTDRLTDNGTDGYETTDDLLLNALGPVYSRLGGNTDNEGIQGTGRGIYDFNTFCTDEAIMPTRGADWYDGGFWQDLYLHDFGGIDAIGDVWNYIFRQVLACNSAIEHINAYAANHPDVDVAPLHHEARALRAMMMFYALDMFGRVPIFESSQPTTGQLALQPRSTTFRYVVDELAEVAPLLPTAHGNNPGQYYGRFTQGPAYFLLAKLMLNAEVYADDDWTDNSHPNGKELLFTINGKNYNAWEATVYYCDQLELLGYGLEPSFSANFAVHNETSRENIFTIPCDKFLYSNQFIYQFRSRHYNHAAALGLNGENGACATVDALITFGYSPDGPSETTDPRFDLTYYSGAVYDLSGRRVTLDDGTPLTYLPWEVTLNLSGSDAEKTAGARMKKYEVDPDGLQDGKLNDNDIVVMRFADALLMKAEASMPCTLDNLLDERMRELAWEGWRRNDIIRFGHFVLPYAHRVTNEKEIQTHYTIVYPIPGEFLTVAAQQQNYGY